MNRNRLGLLILVLVGALVLLWTRDPQPVEPMDGEDAPREAPPAPDLLTADGATPPVAPGLAPRPPAATEPEGTGRGPVRVRVVGPGGAPIPDVFVQPQALLTEDSLGETVATDAQGEVVLADLPQDGSAKLRFYRNDPARRRRGPKVGDRLGPRYGGANQRVVTGPDLVYRAETGLALAVRVVAADTGGDVAGARVGSRHARGAEARLYAAAPRTFLVMPYVGVPWTLGWHVEPQDGWVAWERAFVSATVSPYARALEAVYPLRRELDVTVVPLESEGGIAPAAVHAVKVAGRGSPRWSGVEGTRGELRVGGVPFLRDEILDIQLCRPDRTGPVRVRTVLPDHPAARVELQVVMPKDGLLDDSSFNEAIGIGGRSSSSFRLGGRHPYANAIVVTVRRRNGKPAVGAEVSCGRRKSRRADAQGRVRFERLAPGEHEVAVRCAGLLPMQRTVIVSERGEVEIELREGAGGSLDVAVVDDEQRPLAFTALEVKTPSGLPWIDMPDGALQRIDPFTDSLGRRQLTHLEPGTVEIKASWGSREETVKVDVKEGEATGVFVVLARPAPPR